MALKYSEYLSSEICCNWSLSANADVSLHKQATTQCQVMSCAQTVHVAVNE